LRSPAIPNFDTTGPELARPDRRVTPSATFELDVTARSASAAIHRGSAHSLHVRVPAPTYGQNLVVFIGQLQGVGDTTVENCQSVGTVWIIKRPNQNLAGSRGKPNFLDKVRQFREANGWDVDGMTFRGSLVESGFSSFRKGRVPCKIPSDRVGIDDNGRHQLSSRGKFFHISRWFSSISSAVSVMFKSAHSPLPLHRGFKGVDSLHG